MVNELQQIADRVVKVEAAPKIERGVTSRGGLSLAQSVARRMRLISDARRHLPARKDPSQGFETSAVALSLIHGLLSGGRGWQATESMRGDGPLLKLLGLKRAPSAETVAPSICARRAVDTTVFMAGSWALPPTRDTDFPTSTAGRMPFLKNMGDR